MMEVPRLSPAPGFNDVHSVQDAKSFIHYCLANGQPLKALSAVSYFVQKALPEACSESSPLLPVDFQEEADITALLATARHLGKMPGNGLAVVQDSVAALYSLAPKFIEDLIPQAEALARGRYQVH